MMYSKTLLHRIFHSGKYRLSQNAAISPMNSRPFSGKTITDRISLDARSSQELFHSHNLLAINTQPHKRLFSLTTTSNIWLPWNRTNNEPSAISTNAPPTPVSPDVTSTVTENVSTSAMSDPTVLADVVSGAIVDPPFIEMGLATKWFPNHLVHQLLEFVHLNTGLEWWSTIIIGTMVIRVITLPLFIYTRKTAINTQNHAKELEKHQSKLEKYLFSDDDIRLQVARKEMKDFYKRTKTGPIRTLLTAPSMSVIFISCVMALRQMAAVPVPSLTEGGLFWFTDLSLPDPYHALPIITGGIMGVYIHVMLKSGTLPPSYIGIIRKAKYLPVILMPLVFGKTSSAVLLYWMTTSIFSLCFQRLLLVPGMKEKLRFPSAAPRELQSAISSQSKGMKQMIKDWREDSYRRTEKKMRSKDIKREEKRFARERKRILKGDPPVTYDIGIDAIPSKVEVPDFQREWKPPKPKAMGYF